MTYQCVPVVSSSKHYYAELKHLKHGTSPISCVKYTEDGMYCMSGANEIKLWNPDRGLLIKTYKVPHGSVLDLAIARDSTTFLSCGTDRAALIWDVSTGKCLRRLEGHGGRINCVALGGSQQAVALTGSYDCTVRLFDLRSRNLIQVLGDSEDSVTSVLLASDKGQNPSKKALDNFLITSSVDGCCRSYDLRKGLLHCDDLGVPITNVTLSRDGKCIALSCLDSAVRLLELSSGHRLNIYTGHIHKNYALKAAFSHDDAIIASPSEDGHILLWRLVEADLVVQLKTATTASSSSQQQIARPTSAIAWHPTKSNFLVATYDGIVSYWGAGSFSPAITQPPPPPNSIHKSRDIIVGPTKPP